MIVRRVGLQETGADAAWTGCPLVRRWVEAIEA